MFKSNFLFWLHLPQDVDGPGATSCHRFIVALSRLWSMTVVEKAGFFCCQGSGGLLGCPGKFQVS